MIDIRKAGSGRHMMQRIRHLHFVGIGGAGMSGLAEILLNMSYKVSGSDLRENDVTDRLKSLGAKIYPGHDAHHIAGADVVIVSSAVKAENPELKAARELRIPVVPRAEMLAQLMRFKRGIAVAGTHGKTTTTSLTAMLLEAGGLEPTYVIGGLLNQAGSNAKLGEGEYLVAEADESDVSFLLLQPVMAVVTNIDKDHLSAYDNDYNKLKQAFQEFLHHLPFYGLAVLCREDEQLMSLLPDLGRTVLTYGFREGADVRALNVRQAGMCMHFDVLFPDGSIGEGMKLRMPGTHNVLNALAALSIAWELGVEEEKMKLALENFGGIGRRFQVNERVEIHGGQVVVVEDYGHHPSELAVTISAARNAWPDKRLVMVFQPHRFTRTQELFDDFVSELSAVDHLILTEVYPAGEAPIATADGRALSAAIRVRGKVNPVFVENLDELGAVLPDVLADGDVVLISGAGDIGSFAKNIRVNSSLVGALQ